MSNERLSATVKITTPDGKSFNYPIDAFPKFMVGQGPNGPVPIKADSGGALVIDTSGGTNVTGRVLTATAGQTKSIPAGATAVGVLLLTGTATFGGDALPVGTPVNFAGPLIATDVVFASPGTGIVTYQS